MDERVMISEEEIMELAKKKEGKKPPVFWRSTLEDIENTIAEVKKGRVTTTVSAGGRNIYMVEYGKKNKFNRMANLSSAGGYGDSSCYADKAREDVRPCLLLIGAQHGAEIEGTSALLNLIHVIETGKDYGGKEFPQFADLDKKMNLLIIPCMNPDGRSRVPFSEVEGMTFDEFRYYAQGTWADGTLAGWPGCKQKHPILKYAGHLGSYYNDDGVNLMHDDFFAPMANETKFLLDTVDEYVPDATVLLHGGSNSPSHILAPTCVPEYFKSEARHIAINFQRRCDENGLYSSIRGFENVDTNLPVRFNAASAVVIKCGELCFTYETNQGLEDYDGYIRYTPEQIYLQHTILFEEMIDYVTQLQKQRTAKP